MNADEMREKHREIGGVDFPLDCEHCFDPYPCDTILALDALDAALAERDRWMDGCAEQLARAQDLRDALEALKAEREAIVEALEAEKPRLQPTWDRAIAIVRSLTSEGVEKPWAEMSLWERTQAADQALLNAEDE